jgi:tetratricopeptide (TPR) repeat protein
MTPEPTSDLDRTSAQPQTPGTVGGDPHDPRTVAAAARTGHPRGWPDVPGFAVTAELARGGMGCVYAGRELGLDREVAIKTLLPGANSKRFVTEAKVTARLPHPNIPPVYAFGRLADGGPFLAMKFVRGRTLAELLSARESPAADLPRFIHVFEQIAQAVGFAHEQGVIHRDLKPLNVMVGGFGEVQVMDWGLAREMRVAERDTQAAGDEGTELDAAPAADAPADPRTPPADLTRAGQVMGTPAYMAPEQARGEAVDARADVFALGAILTVILTGKPAFVADTVGGTVAKAARADLTDAFDRLAGCGGDAELVALARGCLAADPGERPASGQQVADTVAAYRAGVEARLRAAETARAVSAADAASARKRRQIVTFAAAAVIAVLTAGVAVSWAQTRRARGAEADERAQRQAAEIATAKAIEEEQKATERERAERKAREEAQRQQRIADKTRQFLIDYFSGRATWVGGVTVGGPSGPDVTLREVVGFAEGAIGKEFAEFPEAELELRLTFAAMSHMLGSSAGYDRHIGRARELAKQLGMENSSGMRTLEAQAEMFTAFRAGTLLPGGLDALVRGAVPGGGAGGAAGAMNAHLIRGAFAFQLRDFATAETEFRAAIALAEEARGPAGAPALLARLLLGAILAAADRMDKAQAEFDLIEARGRAVEWGELPVALARAYSLTLRVSRTADDAAVLALADGLERAKADFERFGMWDTEHGAMLVSGLARLRQAQKRPREAAELLARVYRAAEKNPLLPRCEIAYRAAVEYFQSDDIKTADFYISIAMSHPAWPSLPADIRENGRLIRGMCRYATGRYAEAEEDMRPDLPARMRGPLAQKFTAATLGAALGNREYLKPFLDAVPGLAANPQAAAQTLGNLLHLAAVAKRERNYDLAVELFTAALALPGAGGVEYAPDVLHQRGQCLAALGRHADAVRDFRPVVAHTRKVFGEAGAGTREVTDELAASLAESGAVAEAIALRKQTFEAARRAWGDRPDAAWDEAAKLIAACRAANDYSAISPDAKTPVAALVALVGDDDTGKAAQPRVAVKLRPRAVAVEVTAALADARATALGELAPDTTAAVYALFGACRDLGDLGPSVPVLERIARFVEKRRFSDQQAGFWVNELATAQEASGRAADAEPWRRKWLAIAEGGTHAGTLANARILLGMNLLRQQKWVEAEPPLRAVVAWFEKQPESWGTFDTRSLLGGALLGQKDYDAARPLLVSGYEGLKAREGEIPLRARDRLTDAADRLVALAVATGDEEGVKRWKAERARYKEVAPMPRAKASGEN